jgi:hypothetical protein
MSSKITKISIGFIIVLIMFAVVQAAVDNRTFLPMVLYSPSKTPKPTITGTPYTPTPTRTVTPTRTITPTPTETLRPGFHINHIEHTPDDDELDEYVSITNATGETVYMEGWIIRNEHQPPDIYTFPEFSLRSGRTVKVWTKSGTNSSTDLYWGRTEPVWNPGGDCAYLRKPDPDDDDETIFVTSYCYGD